MATLFLLFHCVSLMPPGCGVVVSAMLFFNNCSCIITGSEVQGECADLLLLYYYSLPLYYYYMAYKSRYIMTGSESSGESAESAGGAGAEAEGGGGQVDEELLGGKGEGGTGPTETDG